MKYIVKKEGSILIPEDDYRGIDRYAYSRLALNYGKIFQIEHCEINWQENKYHYMLYMDGNNANNYNTRYFLLDDKTFEEYFRLPVKNHWQVKICTENECNEFLKELDVDCLKDIKMTDNCLMVIYKVKGEI